MELKIPELMKGRFHGFDTETTGVDVENDRIVTATFTTFTHEGVEASTSWLVNPGIDIPAPASAVHGISTEHAREHGMPPAEAVLQIMGVLSRAFIAGEPVAVYNAPYDFTLLDRELRRHVNQGLHDVPFVLDPLVLDKKANKFVRGKGARKLVNTARRYGVVLTEEEAHTSAGDVLATARLLWKMVTRHPALFDRTLPEMQEAQRAWHYQQTVDFAEWLERSKGAQEAAAVRAEAGKWPMRLPEHQPKTPVQIIT